MPSRTRLLELDFSFIDPGRKSVKELNLMTDLISRLGINPENKKNLALSFNKIQARIYPVATNFRNTSTSFAFNLFKQQTTEKESMYREECHVCELLREFGHVHRYFKVIPTGNLRGDGIELRKEIPDFGTWNDQVTERKRLFFLFFFSLIVISINSFSIRIGMDIFLPTGERKKKRKHTNFMNNNVEFKPPY